MTMAYQEKWFHFSIMRGRWGIGITALGVHVNTPLIAVSRWSALATEISSESTGWRFGFWPASAPIKEGDYIYRFYNN